MSSGSIRKPRGEVRRYLGDRRVDFVVTRSAAGERATSMKASDCSRVSRGEGFGILEVRICNR